MARSKNNIITQGMSGMLGRTLVFRQINGETIVAKAPKEREGEGTPNQQAQKAKFQQAVLYAKSVLQDPLIKEAYQNIADRKNKGSAYTVAVADFLQGPEISKIDLSNYSGNIGDTISIQVTDNYMVALVNVLIENPDGSLVERGQAVQQGTNWIYTATANNSDLNGDKITIQAFDTPDNMSEKINLL